MNKKLWQKDYSVLPEIEEFATGEDYALDNQFIEEDILTNIAHAEMLHSVGILNDSETDEIKKTLVELLKLTKSVEFKITPDEEDVHTAVENYLTKRNGATGEKIHLGKSRNDQIISDLRLYSKRKLISVGEALLSLSKTTLNFAKKHRDIPMVGYTHSRKAMPSSVGLWAGAFLESFLDDFRVMWLAYELNDQCPLGSAASYGVNLPVDRELERRLLGFKKIQNNLLYVNNSRGKIESIILFALSQIMLDLAKLSEDLILFTREEFEYFTLSKEILTGSSIMPQKRNPDVLELIRAKYVKVESSLFMLLNILKGLPSGYNRDLQLTKESLITGFETTYTSLRIMETVIGRLGVNEENLLKGFSREVFAADEAARLAKEGVPFRQAYRKVVKNLNQLKKEDPYKNIKEKSYKGATGNLSLQEAEEGIDCLTDKLKSEKKKFEKIKRELLK